mgnify:CR=1 FL=1
MDAAPVLTPMEGFTDNYSEAFMVAAQIPESSVKVCIFAPSLKGARPGKDDKVKFTRGGVVEWYQIRKAKIDPAGALWECESFMISGGGL